MSTNDVLRESCAECPNPLKPDAVGNRQCDMNNNGDCTWCTGGGDCEIHTFKSLDQQSLPSLSYDTCVGMYIFERSLVFRKVLNYVCFNLRSYM